MLRLPFATAMLFTLGACASSYNWVKTGMTADSRESDIVACVSKASSATKDETQAISIVDRCMADRGYLKQLNQ